MAKNQVTLTFAGDSKSLERTFDKVGAGAKNMAGDLDKASGKAKGFGSAMDGVGASVGSTESKFMGSADLLDGLGGAFGLPTDGAVGLMRAFGDLSGGFEVVQGFLTTGAGKLAQFGKAIFTASTYTGIWTGVQTAFNTVMALNPAILITAAIIGLGAALVLAYQKSETFRNIVQTAFRIVKNAAEDVWNFIQGFADKVWEVAGDIKDALVWPYKTAFNLVAKIWNRTVGSLSFSIPDWVPMMGGKGFSMPKLPTFHTGGTVPGNPGQAVPILAMAGETVTRAGTGGGTVINVNFNGVVGDPAAAARQIDSLLRNARNRGVIPA